VESNPLASKTLINDDKSRVEDSEQQQRQDKHEYVVESVEVQQLVRETVTQLSTSQSVHRGCSIVDGFADQGGLHPAGNVEHNRE